MVQIDIAKQYTKTPGGRYSKEGKFSGEDFRNSILIPRYLEAFENNQILRIKLDGGYGYGSSFLEEAFGGLVRSLHEKGIVVDPKRIELISDEEPQLIEDIYDYISAALEKKRT